MKKFSILTLTAATQLVGCASIVSGQNQSVSVETRNEAGPISGASCKLFNNKGAWFVTSPGTTTVQRSFEDLSVRCEKDLMEAGLSSVKSSTKAMAFGNIIFGGPIGVGVDVATGAAYDYPAVITIFMPKTTSSVAPYPLAAPTLISQEAPKLTTPAATSLASPKP